MKRCRLIPFTATIALWSVRMVTPADCAIASMLGILDARLSAGHPFARQTEKASRRSRPKASPRTWLCKAT